jgi:hypothetical protein
MSSRTQERLRDAATALGQSVQPQDIPDLRLPDVSWQPARHQGRRWRMLTTHALIPVGAGAAVLALVLSLTVASKIFQGSLRTSTTRSASSPPVSTPSSTPPTSPSKGMPKYLVAAVQGHGYIASSATGRTVAVIPPPAGGTAIEGIAVAPDGRTCYLVAAGLEAGSGSVRLEFFRFSLSATGQPGRPERIPGKPVVVPLPVSSDALEVVQLAISPDGSELAFAPDNQLFPDNYPATHPAGITVLNVATGASRTWTTWPAADTEISTLSWAVGGQLSYTATLGDASVSGGQIVRHSGSDTTGFLILNTAEPGSDLIGSSRPVIGYSHSVPAGGSVPPQSAVIAGVISTDGRRAYAELDGSGGVAELARISTETGAIVQVLLRGSQALRAEPGGIDGRYLLFTLGPRREVTPTARYTCGHLAGLKVPSGPVTQLPFPIDCSTVAPPPALQAAW